jgi:NADPH:quinone reductase-like Zn-dependent oxidoreductase
MTSTTARGSIPASSARSSDPQYVPALTAHRAVFADGPVAGQTLLVTGGAGAVGAYAIQFAKLGGARPDHREQRSEGRGRGRRRRGLRLQLQSRERVQRIADLPGGGGVDRIVEVEFGGNLPQSLEILRPNGVIAAYASDAVPEPKVPFYAIAYKSATVRFILVFIMPEAAKRQAIDDITRWLEAGELRHYIPKRLPLAEAVAAHQAMEAGVIGNIVLEIASDLLGQA